MQGTKKRQRVNSLPVLTERSCSLSKPKASSSLVLQGNGEQPNNESIAFNDPNTSDVLLFLHPQQSPPSVAQDGQDMDTKSPCNKVYLHSSVLQQCKYFATILSERWQELSQPNTPRDHDQRIPINMTIPVSRGFSPYFTVLQLLYSRDFTGIIINVPIALSCLPVAAELLYDDCITACIRYLEAIPWTEEQEKQIVKVVSCLQLKESTQLLARVIPAKVTAVEDMLKGLVYAATHSNPNGATVKGFVAKLLCDHASKETVRHVLDYAFASSLKLVKDSVEEYSSPNVRGRHDEIEALQRMNLHTALINGKHLLWLVERMIELRVAENAVMEWSEQGAFTANLQRAFHDDVWRSIAPGLPGLVLRCTCRLASAVAGGSIIVAREVRMKLVKDWLPVLIVSRENPTHASPKTLYYELEGVFLQIILTLPMEYAQELLPQCLSFATRNVNDCPHLVSAFDTWFRRASQLPTTLSGGECSEQSM